MLLLAATTRRCERRQPEQRHRGRFGNPNATAAGAARAAAAEVAAAGREDVEVCPFALLNAARMLPAVSVAGSAVVNVTWKVQSRLEPLTMGPKPSAVLDSAQTPPLAPPPHWLALRLELT